MSEQMKMLDANELRERLNESEGPQDNYELGIEMIDHIIYLQSQLSSCYTREQVEEILKKDRCVMCGKKADYLRCPYLIPKAICNYFRLKEGE